MSSADTLLKFLDRLRDWKQLSAVDEWFFSNARDDLVTELSPAEAFDAINELVQHVLNEPNDDVRLELVAVLVSLARRSDTTQIPQKLNSSWDEVRRRVEATGEYGHRQIESLRAWYRRSASDKSIRPTNSSPSQT